MTKQKAAAELRSLALALKCDGSIKQLREVLKTVWPEDSRSEHVGVINEFYIQNIKIADEWEWVEHQHLLPTISVTEFLELEDEADNLDIRVRMRDGKCYSVTINGDKFISSEL